MRMTEIATLVTTGAEIDAALAQARIDERFDRRASSVNYAQGTDSFLLRLEHGETYSVPRRLLQGLSDADAEALREIELLGAGTGIYWPALDVAHSVSGLLAGVYGSAKWMARLQQQAALSRRSA
jgi:hypothetical protein